MSDTVDGSFEIRRSAHQLSFGSFSHWLLVFCIAGGDRRISNEPSATVVMLAAYLTFRRPDVKDVKVPTLWHPWHWHG